jgi:hypothetical protein
MNSSGRIGRSSKSGRIPGGMRFTAEIARLKAEREEKTERLSELETHGGYHGVFVIGDSRPVEYLKLPEPELEAEKAGLKTEIAEIDAELANLEAAREKKLNRVNASERGLLDTERPQTEATSEGRGRGRAAVADALGIRLSGLEALALSRGHYDHTCGLGVLLQEGSLSAVFVTPRPYSRNTQRATARRTVPSASRRPQDLRWVLAIALSRVSDIALRSVQPVGLAITAIKMAQLPVGWRV